LLDLNKQLNHYYLNQSTLSIGVWECVSCSWRFEKWSLNVNTKTYHGKEWRRLHASIHYCGLNNNSGEFWLKVVYVLCQGKMLVGINKTSRCQTCYHGKHCFKSCAFELWHLSHMMLKSYWGISGIPHISFATIRHIYV